VPASRALPSESLPAVNLTHAPPGLRSGSTPGSWGYPKVIFFITEAYWAKSIFCDGITYTWTDRLDGKNSDLDLTARTFFVECNFFDGPISILSSKRGPVHPFPVALLYRKKGGEAAVLLTKFFREITVHV